MTASGTYWTAATSKFDGDTYFCGGDGGGSVDLGSTRVLWFFNDPFIRTAGGQARSAAAIIRNCVAIQSVSYDLSAATMTYYCGGGGMGSASPASFFPEHVSSSGLPFWSWGGSGVMLDGVLLIFVTRVSPVVGGAFNVVGYDVILVDNPTAAPSAWELKYLEPPKDGVLAYIANVQDGGDGYVYASAGANDAARSLMWVRWDRARAKVGDLSGPQYWRGAFGWSQRDQGRPPRSPVYQAGATSSPTGGVVPRASDYALVASPGFGSVGISLKYALNAARTGPFGALSTVFTPYGTDPNLTLSGSNYFVYAGGAHPEQTWSGKGANDMLLTYSTNAAGSHNVRLDETIYYVRPVKGVGLT